MKLILASRDHMSREDFVFAQWALDNGVDAFWMRDLKDWEKHEKFLLGLFSGYGPRIRVATDAKIPHLKHFKKGLDPDLSYHSASVHSLEEWADKKLLGIQEAYISPCFPSISKAGHGSESDISQFAWVKDIAAEVDCYALGGIDIPQIPLIPNYFKGIIVLGSVWNAPQAHDALKNIVKACRS